MTQEDLKTKLHDLHNIKREFQKMIQSSNLSYVNNVAALLKETNIDTFIKTSESLNNSHQHLETIIKSAVTDIDKEIESVANKLNKTSP